MKELEVQTYNFAVEGIGLIKSLEKEYPDMVPDEMKQCMGKVSLKYIDALGAKENEDFANNIRDCLANAKKSAELLNALNRITDTALFRQKEKMMTDSRIIIEKLEGVVSKLIY